MLNTKQSRKLPIYESIGFAILITFIWINEILDLPHLLFNSIATPVNFTESMLETGVVILVWIFTVLTTLQLMKQIKVLQGFLPICASCKKIRTDKGEWSNMESYIEQHSHALFSHGICPECQKKLYGDQEWYKKKRETE